MGRRSSFGGLINQVARQAARSQRQAVAAHNRQVREQARYAKQLLRDLKQSEKEARQQYLDSRQLEADEFNDELNEQVRSFQLILEHTLSVDDSIAFDSLRIIDDFEPIQIPAELSIPKKEPERFDFKPRFKCKRVGFIEKLFHGENGKNNRIPEYQAEHDKEWEIAYQAGKSQWLKSEKERTTKLEKFKTDYEKSKQDFTAKMTQRNAEVDELEKAYNAGDPEAIVTYNVMVLERSQYPDDFPQEFRVAFVPESKELVIEYELPNADIIPAEAEHKFIKARDEIQVKPRKATELKSIYQDIVASVCLRTLHEVIEADKGNHLSLVTINGFVQTVDRTTGRDIRPYLISARITKETFLEIDLSRIDKKSCLRNLGAQVSPAPYECVAIKPIVNFNMVDRRFVEGSDVLSELDARPNLMDLDPFEFENLVGNLFMQMGLDTRQTQTSRDGGVDVIAFDTRPIFGGKVVIQAKRYKNTVGIAAARDLYGTMINEGASKGILITTSHYGAATYDFVKDKPIELIDGAGMLYLLEQHTNTKAKIIMPDE
jgi:restriction system protein